MKLTLLRLFAQFKSIPFASIGKSVWSYVSIFFQWFMQPIRFALGPLLIMSALSYKACQGQRTAEQKSVVLTDSLKLALSDVRYLQADTAQLRSLNRTYVFKLNQANEAYKIYYRYVLNLADDDLQREIDRVYNSGGQPQ